MVEGCKDGLGAVVVSQEAEQTFIVVLYTVVATVQHADVKSQGLQEPDREGVGAVMQGGLVQGKVALHGVRSEAMGYHDVIDGVVGSFDAPVEVPELAGGLVQGNGAYPSHGCFGETSKG